MRDAYDVLQEDFSKALMQIEVMNKDRDFAANLNQKYIRENTELRCVLDSYEDLCNRLAKQNKKLKDRAVRWKRMH